MLLQQSYIRALQVIIIIIIIFGGLGMQAFIVKTGLTASVNTEWFGLLTATGNVDWFGMLTAMYYGHWIDCWLEHGMVGATDCCWEYCLFWNVDCYVL